MHRTNLRGVNAGSSAPKMGKLCIIGSRAFHLFLLRGVRYKCHGAHNGDESSHFAIVSKPTFQEVTGGKLLNTHTPLT